MASMGPRAFARGNTTQRDALLKAADEKRLTPQQRDEQLRALMEKVKDDLRKHGVMVNFQ